MKKIILTAAVSLMCNYSVAAGQPLKTVIKQNGLGQKLEISGWDDGLRRWKYAVTEVSNRSRYYWYAQGGSKNAGENNAPHTTSNDQWCRVRELFGDSVHIPECDKKFMYKSYLIKGFNDKHYEIWYRPSSLSYYKLREQESGTWYAHDGSSNDGRKHTSKKDWCRVILVQGNGIIVPPKACDDVKNDLLAAVNLTATPSVSASEAAAMIEMVNTSVDIVTDPAGFMIGKTTGGIKEVLNLRGKNAAGITAEVGGTAIANAAIAAAMFGPAGALSGLAVGLVSSGAQELLKASKDTTLSMQNGFQNHPRFDLDLNGISTSNITYPEPIIWTQVSGKVSDIDVGADGSVWAISNVPEAGGFGILKFNSTANSWDKIAGGATKIDVDHQGNPWVVNDQGLVFKRKNNQWANIPGTVTDLGVGSSGDIWATGKTKLHGGFDIYKLNGDRWDKQHGEAVLIDVDHKGNPWVVNKFNDIYKRQNDSWVKLPGKATDIGVSSENSVWVTGNNTQIGGFGIYKWNGDKVWGTAPGSATKITVDSNGLPWVVNSNGDVFKGSKQY